MARPWPLPSQPQRKMPRPLPARRDVHSHTHRGREALATAVAGRPATLYPRHTRVDRLRRPANQRSYEPMPLVDPIKRARTLDAGRPTSRRCAGNQPASLLPIRVSITTTTPPDVTDARILCANRRENERIRAELACSGRYRFLVSTKLTVIT
ncbi:hypothetical protein [Oryza sativa Japonica Group]|uniref:Uncharacterized protein n=1 Tax=Oryza sativa subsp. japonica TaxID=39947 RepID=Q9FTK7_ORYSJ|nr:hypothetical protein [Oryza sativa Japonica Group]BAB40085.1 hypothetical protein [Oryza sativa Japonica Group]